MTLKPTIAFSALFILSATSNFAFLNGAIATENSVSYESDFSSADSTLPIFKFTNNNGKVTYSTSMPEDFVEAEEIDLAQPPLNKSIEETKEINETLKAAADELSSAREKRESVREEKEKKRLEKLALVNQSKPPVVYQKNTYVAYPYYYRRAKNHHKHNVKPAHLPARTHPDKHGPNLPNSVTHHP